MSFESFIELGISSLIFNFPRRFPITLYTKITRFFKGKKKNPAPEIHDPLLDSDDPEEVKLANEFKKACKAVETSSALSNKDLVQFYGLFKQATVGDCDRPKPSESSIVEFTKWYL